MSLARPSTGRLVGVTVGLTVAGMLLGTGLLLASEYRAAGWLLFVLSFGGWLGAALLAMREGWHRGWFDK